MKQKLIKVEIYVHKRKFVGMQGIERFLVEVIVFYFDRLIIENSFRRKYKLNITNYLQYKGGDLLTFKKQILYKLNFEANLAFSVLLDRMGNFLTFNIPRNHLLWSQAKNGNNLKGLDFGAIKSWELKLLHKLIGSLDIDALKKIFKDKFNFGLQGAIKCKTGDIVTYNHEVAYKLVFESKVAFSMLLDRMGNSLSLIASDELAELAAALEKLPDKQETHMPTKLIRIGSPKKPKRFKAPGTPFLNSAVFSFAR